MPTVGELNEAGIKTHKISPPDPVVTDYKQGQQVYVVGMGYGKIVFIADKYQGYPILVEYDDPPNGATNKRENYTADGKIWEDDLYPTLLHRKPVDLDSCYYQEEENVN